jgi:hypothetical protein
MITVTVDFETNKDGVDILRTTFSDDCDSEIGWQGDIPENSVLGEQLCVALDALATLEEKERAR